MARFTASDVELRKGQHQISGRLWHSRDRAVWTLCDGCDRPVCLSGDDGGRDSFAATGSHMDPYVVFCRECAIDTMNGWADQILRRDMLTNSIPVAAH